MTDRYAVIWTRTAAGPLKMGNLVATTRENRFTYTDEFLESGNAAGLSLLAGPQLFGRQPVVHQTSERMPLHPRLLALTPGEAPGNIQRRVYANLLAKRRPPPAPGFETEWEILMLAGHNGIGHLDVFRDDRDALQRYANPPPTDLLTGQRSDLWGFIRNEVRQTAIEESAAVIAELLGPTPSVGGMTPKLLAAIPDTPEWAGAFAAPGARPTDDSRYVDVVLKIESPGYEGVAALEALCLDIHSELGFEVPRYWRAEVDGMRLLAVERFDRTPEGLPVPMESFLSVMASGSRNIQGTQDTDMRSVGAMLDKLATVVNLKPRATQEQVFRRFCLAFFTGNGDLHLENLSFLGGPDDVRLAPVYDPAPMRAWSRHNLRSAIPIVFDDDLGGLGDNLAALGPAFGMTRNDAAELLLDTMEKTRDYTARVMALDDVPRERRQALVDLLEKERQVIDGSLTRATKQTPLPR